MTFKLLNLTVDRDPFKEFDRIKRLYYRNKNINFSFIYNDDIDYNFIADKEDIMYRIGIPVNYKNFLNTSLASAEPGIPMMLQKFLAEIKKPEYLKYDYVIRTNSSSFINIDKLKELLDSQVIPPNAYAGFHYQCNTFPNIPSFISGTFIIISRNVIEVLRNIVIPDNILYQCDDVALGILIETMCDGIPYNIPMHFCDLNALSLENTREMVKNNIILRIKDGTLERNNPNDLNIWQNIHQIVNN